MNKLSQEKQFHVLSLLVEGNSIRSTERVTKVHRDTIMRLLVSAGDKASAAMDANCRGLVSKYIQIDEIWTYIGIKQRAAKRRGLNNDENPFLGDQWVFVVMDAQTKLVPIFRIGKRTMENADRVMEELSNRVIGRFQLSTDAFQPYRLSVMKYFGSDRVDYGQVIKSYGTDRYSEVRYSPSRIVSVTLRPVFGNPDITQISTSYIERQNLTIRMQNRRFTRLTNAYSKKLENLQAAMALHFFHYNFMRPHTAHSGATPAMAAGIARSIWTWDDLYNGVRTQRLAA